MNKLILTTALLMLAAVGDARAEDWARREPAGWHPRHRGAHYEYRGAELWDDFEPALEAACEAAPHACENLWIVITRDAVDTPATPGGRRPDGRPANGATWTERKWPWSSPLSIVVLKQDASTPTAADSELWSEICGRVLPHGDSATEAEDCVARAKAKFRALTGGAP